MAKVKIHSSTKTNIFDTSLGVLAKLNIVVKKIFTEDMSFCCPADGLLYQQSHMLHLCFDHEFIPQICLFS